MKKYLLTLGVVVSFATIGYGQDQSVNGNFIVNGQTKIINPLLERSLLLEKDDNDSWLTFHDPGQHWYSMGIDRSNSGAFSLNKGGDLNSTEFVLLNGNIGINIKEPREKLEVNGNIQIDGSGSSNDSPLGALTFFNTSSYTYATLAKIQAHRGLSSHQKGDIAFYVKDGNELKEAVRIYSNGNLGIGKKNPQAFLDVGKYSSGGTLSSVLARLSEGDSSGGTFLGVKGYVTQGDLKVGIKSFALEHSFYGKTNSAINFYRGGSIEGGFITFTTNDNTEKMRITENGNIGIGTTNPDQKLTVKGVIHAQEVQVDLAGTVAPDYVFEKYYEGTSRLKSDYTMPTLEEVAQFTKEHKHLPSIPSAQELEENGMHLKEMTRLLLQKIEELTLYTIEQNKINKEQAQEIKELQSQLIQLKIKQ